MKTFALLVDPNRDDNWQEEAKRDNRDIGLLMFERGAYTPFPRDNVLYRKDCLCWRAKPLIVKRRF